MSVSDRIFKNVARDHSARRARAKKRSLLNVPQGDNVTGHFKPLSNAIMLCTGVVQYPAKQSGAAIIMVLLIVALATSLAAYMSEQQSLWQRQVESQFSHVQARRLGIAGIDWSRAVLGEDARRANDIDHEQELWAMQLPALPVEGGEVIGIIKDRQGLFNLNNLARNNVRSQPDIEQFQRLLEILRLPTELASDVADFILPQNDTENVYYLGLAHPYRASKQQLTELGELALIRGFDKKTIVILQDFVTVLPDFTPINVNFASPEVLAAVLKNMTLADARMMVQQRKGNPFKTVQDFSGRLPKGNISIPANSISVTSNYFLVTGRANLGEAQVTTQALLHRTSGWPKVVWQSVQ